jgi:hypothetical protein
MNNGVRMVFFWVAIVATLLSFQLTSDAQQVKDASYQAITDNFFKMVKDGKATDAVDYIFATNPAMTKVSDEVQQVKSQFGSLKPLMGEYISHTKIAETEVAGMFVYQHYFVAYERQPISVRIKYYKPADKWLCYGLQFDGELSALIEKNTDSRIPIEVK